MPVPSLPTDTFRLVSLLKERGFTEQQAGGIVEAILEIDLSSLVTREYLHRELKELELRMTIKLGGLIVAGTGALAALQILR